MSKKKKKSCWTKWDFKTVDEDLKTVAGWLACVNVTPINRYVGGVYDDGKKRVVDRSFVSFTTELLYPLTLIRRMMPVVKVGPNSNSFQSMFIESLGLPTFYVTFDSPEQSREYADRIRHFASKTGWPTDTSML